jgi:hypothetical protein
MRGLAFPNRFSRASSREGPIEMASLLLRAARMFELDSSGCEETEAA